MWLLIFLVYWNVLSFLSFNNSDLARVDYRVNDTPSVRLVYKHLTGAVIMDCYWFGISWDVSFNMDLS